MLRFVLLVLVVVGVAAWWLRRDGARDRPATPPPPPPTGAPGREAMTRCPHCGVHVPESQAWPGRGGAYCSAEHRAAHESGPA